MRIMVVQSVFIYPALCPSDVSWLLQRHNEYVSMVLKSQDLITKLVPDVDVYGQAIITATWQGTQNVKWKLVLAGDGGGARVRRSVCTHYTDAGARWPDTPGRRTRDGPLFWWFIHCIEIWAVKEPSRSFNNARGLLLIESAFTIKNLLRHYAKWVFKW